MKYKNIANYSFFFIFLLFLEFDCLSQTGSLSGTVIKSDGKALYKADVTIKETGKTTQTDTGGNYNFSSLASQKYTLEISKIFYEKKTTTASVSDGQNTPVSAILLDESGPVASLNKLLNLIKTGQIEVFSQQVEDLGSVCKKENFSDCITINELIGIAKTKNINELELKTYELLYSVGIIAQETYLFERGKNQLAEKQYSAAIISFTKLIDIEQTAAFAYSNLGEAYKGAGDFNMAIANYNEAINLSPRSPDFYLSRAKVYEAKGDKVKAAIDLKTAKELLRVGVGIFF